MTMGISNTDVGNGSSPSGSADVGTSASTSGVDDSAGCEGVFTGSPNRLHSVLMARSACC